MAVLFILDKYFTQKQNIASALQVESRGRMHGRTRALEEIRIPASGKLDHF